MKKIILFTLLCLFTVLIALYFTFNTKEALENILSLRIPKIIHQTAPSDTKKWHPVWYSCQKSWKKYFPTYQYMMWTDEDLNNLIKTDFPEYLEMFQGYDQNIKRVDIARYFILHKYGGIYADMDYECFQNFENLIPQNKVSISESPYIQNEYLQNALMISPKGHPFWSKVIEKGKSRAGTTSNNNNYKNNNSVLYQTGPQLVSDVYFENTSMVNVLPKDLWNPDKALPFNSKLICRHLGTYSWA